MIRDHPTDPERYEQFFDHKLKLKKNDKIVIKKEFLKKLDLEKAQSVRMPFFFGKDEFLEENVEFARNMILRFEDEFLFLNKPNGVGSQPGKKGRVNLYYLFNLYLYELNQKKILREKIYKGKNEGGVGVGSKLSSGQKELINNLDQRK